MRKQLLYWLSRIFRRIGRFFKHKPMALLLIAFFVSPIGPHLRFEYEYRSFGSNGYRIHTRCTYLGSRGFVDVPLMPECPWFAFVDSRQFIKERKD